jgi:curli biogenesis system outer membrane secretion channel CsgG
MFRLIGALSLLSFSLCMAQEAGAPAATPASAPHVKKRVAVLNFDYGTVMSSVEAIFGSNQDVGKGISDLLVQKLVEDGQYSVIERNALDKVLGEQNFSNSDRADSTTAAKIGRILGVDAVIMGSITQFGRDDKHTNVGGGAFSGWTHGVGGVSTKKATAVVGISGRLVDTTTAEILAAVTGTGESTRSGTSLLGGGGSGWSGGGGGLDMGSSNFGNTILGEAIHAAVNSMATQLDAKAASLPSRKIEFNGIVADVTGNQLVLNIGRTSGVKVGDNIEVNRPLKTVKDPVSGKVIKTITSQVGSAKVTEVDESSATATYTGSTPPKVGDAVKSSAQ